MKKLFLLLLLTSSLAFAIDPQEGSGGNVCTPLNITTSSSISLDELYTWSSSSAEQDWMATRYDQALTKTGLTNLLTTEAGMYMLKTFDALSENGLSELGEELAELTASLSRVYVIDQDITKPYDSASMDLFYCEENSIRAALVSFPAGLTVVSKPTWNKLSLRTQVHLLIHEAFRKAQLHKSWGKSIDTLQVYELTNIIYHQKTTIARENKTFQKLREYLIQKDDLKRIELRDQFLKEHTEFRTLLSSGHFAEAFGMAFDLASTRRVLYKKRNVFPITPQILPFLGYIQDRPEYAEWIANVLAEEFPFYASPKK